MIIPEYLRKIAKEKVENMKVLTDAEKQYILNT
nr:MAG TPA: cleavage stimulation factor domain protein [Caudoviricetes sp.]